MPLPPMPSTDRADGLTEVVGFVFVVVNSKYTTPPVVFAPARSRPPSRDQGVGLGRSGLLPHAQYQCPEPQDSPLAALALDRTLLRSPLVTGNSWSELRHAIHIHRSQPAAWRDKEVKSSIISVRMVGDVRVRERRLMLATSQRVPFFLCRKKRILRPKKGEKAVHPFANLRKKKGVVRKEEK